MTRNNPNGTAFIAKISPSGHGLADLVYSTYYGGQALNNALTGADSGQGIAVSATNAYVTGYMSAPDMLTTAGAFQTSPRRCRSDERVCGRNTSDANDLGISDNPRVWNSADRRAVAAAVRHDNQQHSIAHHVDTSTYDKKNAADFAGAAGGARRQSAALPTGELNAATIGAAIAAISPKHAIIMDEAATTGLPFFGYSAGAPAAYLPRPHRRRDRPGPSLRHRRGGRSPPIARSSPSRPTAAACTPSRRCGPRPASAST